MKKERKRLNKKIVALVLALSMIVGQTQMLFATQSQNVAPEAPAVESAETAAPAAEAGQTDPAQETEGQQAEGQQEETPAQSEAEPSKNEEAQTPAGQTETPAGDAAPSEEAGKVSEDEAEAQEVSKNETGIPKAESETEEKSGASANTGKKLSGGKVYISINQTDYHEIIEFDTDTSKEESRIQSTKIDRFVGEKLKIDDLDVISGNKSDVSNNTTLIKDKDYDLEYLYYFAADESKLKDYLPASGNGISIYTWTDPDSKLVEVLVEISGNDAINGFVPKHSGDFMVVISGKGDYDEADGIMLEGKIQDTEPAEHAVSEADVGISTTYNSITVENKGQYDFYAVLFDSSVSVNVSGGSISGDSYYGYYVAKGDKVTLSEAYKKDGKEYDLSPNTTYTLVAAPKGQISTNSLSMCFVNKAVSTNATPDIFNTDAKDGSEIGFKALIDKKTQKIKLSWAPSKDKGYSSYKIERFNAKELKFEELASSLTKKSYTADADTEANKTPLFKITCTKKDGGTPDEYMTVATPSMLFVENGYTESIMEFTFSKLNEDPNLSYVLQAAEKNKESTGKTDEGKRGFTETSANQTIRATNTGDIPNYVISKNLKITATVAEYESPNTAFQMKVGKTYYFRVKTEYKFGEKTFTSGASNVLSRKSGPAACYIYDVNGVKYTKGKNDDNKANMDKYLNEILDVNAYEYKYDGVKFVHDDNIGPDAKSGYAVALVPKGGTEIKSLDLLRCDTYGGTYKKVKSYNLSSIGSKNSTIYKWEGSDKDKYGWLTEKYDVYYLQYNSFVPEKTQYYTVRAVAKTGSAAGGMGYGYEVTTELDKVQKVVAVDAHTTKSLNLYWKHDDCVKKYRIYRKDAEEKEEGGFDPSKYTLIATVNGKKSGTVKGTETKKCPAKEYYDATGGADGGYTGDFNKYVDKKNVKTGMVYQYVILPVYDTKTKSTSYNIAKASDPVQGAATLSGQKVKGFTTANGGVDRVSLKWKKLGSDSEYLIMRFTEDNIPANPKQATVEEWLTKWEAGGGKMYNDADQNSKSFAYVTAANATTFVDQKARVGTKYYYMILAGNFPDVINKKTVDSLSDPVYKTGKSLPLPVKNLKVSSRTGSESDYRQGAYINWTRDSRDSGYQVRYVVQARDMSNGSSSYGGWYTIGSTMGTSLTDTKSLNRGVVRQYRVVSVYEGINGGIANGGTYSKPTSIEMSTGSKTLAPGESFTLKVTPKRDGDPSGVTATDLDYSKSGNIDVSVKTEGGSKVYTIKATGSSASYASFTVWAKYPEWTDNTSKDNLKKSINITITSAKPFGK